MNKTRRLYTMYRGDEIITTGTAKEIASQLGISVRTVYFYQTPANIKRIGERYQNKRVVVAITERA